MSNEQKTPWYSLPYSRDYATVYTSSGETLIATMKAEHAAHIVRAMNSHDALVSALEDVLKWGDDNGKKFKFSADSDGGVITRLKAALAAARGEL